MLLQSRHLVCQLAKISAKGSILSLTEKIITISQIWQIKDSNKRSDTPNSSKAEDGHDQPLGVSPHLQVPDDE
jgi:hypothetical protein